MQSSSCSSSQSTKQVRVVESAAYVKVPATSKAMSTNAQIFFVMDQKQNITSLSDLTLYNNSQMRLIRRQRSPCQRKNSSIFPSSTSKRGISLSNHKHTNNSINQQTRQANIVCSSFKQTPNSKRKTPINRFVIFDVDRQQWQRTQSVYRETASSQNRMVQSQGNYQDKQNQGYFSTPFTMNMQLTEIQEIVSVPKEKRRVREVRTRLNEIQNRLNSLLHQSSSFK